MTSYKVVHGCMFQYGLSIPMLTNCIVLPLPSAFVSCILPVPVLSQTIPLSSPRVCFALDPCVCCICVLRVQIPTGPLIFNPLQQPQLSQFSPQQSQSATSSPQQQGETVRPTSTLTHVERQSWLHFKQLSFNTEWDIVNCGRQTLNA